MKTLGLLCLGVSSLFTLNASAAEIPRNWLFLGVNASYLEVTPSSARPFEVKKSGSEGVIKLVGSHYFNDFVLDLGAGWAYSYISQQNLSTSSSVKVITRSLIFELSPRARLGQHWQLGPIVQLLIGSDVSYDENQNVEELKNQWRAGGRVQYELGDEYRWRIGAQAYTHLNIKDRSLLGVALDVQFGFAPGGRSPAAAPSPAPVATPVPKPEFAEVHGENIRLYLGEELLRFKTGKFELDAKSKKALNKLSKVLAHHEVSWKQMRIEGHTDIRNHKGQNQVLSEHRAQTVKDLFIAAKLPVDKMTAIGRSATQPIDPAENDHAFALNRRVEIWLDQVDPAKIPAIMGELAKFR